MHAQSDDKMGPGRAQRLRSRAEEIRTATADMQNASARATMLRIAATYERLANFLDGQPNSSNDRADVD